MIAASVVGSWLGAGVVSRFSRRKIQIGMGVALLVMAGFMMASVLNPLPEVGALGLTGGKLAIAVVANAVLGALMTLGIGLVCAVYGPDLLDGHESQNRISHHDGIVRVPHAGRQRALHS
jgi:hypothetical protein